MCAPRASASTSSGCAYSRSIRSRTRRSRARSRRCCSSAGLLVTCAIVPAIGTRSYARELAEAQRRSCPITTHSHVFRVFRIATHNETVWPPRWSRRKSVVRVVIPAVGAALLGGVGWLLGPLWAIAGIVVGPVAAVSVLLIMFVRAKPKPVLLMRSGRPQEAYRQLQYELSFTRGLARRRPMFRDVLAGQLGDNVASAAGAGQRAEGTGDRY